MSAARRKPDASARKDEQRVLQQRKDAARARARAAAKTRNIVFATVGSAIALVALVAAVYYGQHGTPGVATTAVAADLGPPTSATPSTTTDGFSKVSTPAYHGGKPVLLFIGAQFCPHCAAERWSVLKALNQFGSFTNLKRSSSSEANVPTFDVTQSTYTSKYVYFDHKDVQDRQSNPLQPLDAGEQSSFSRYDTNGTIPLILAGGYSIVGDAYNVTEIDGRSFSSVQHALQTSAPTPLVADINAEANTLTAFLCHADGMKPASTCGRPVIRSLVRTLR